MQNGSCDMSMCISIVHARTKRWPCGTRPTFPLHIPHKMAVMTCPCAFPLRRPAQNETSHTKILGRGRLSRDFAKRPLLEILFRDLAKRPLTEIFPTELLERSCTRSCQETSHNDLVQRPGEESNGLPGRSCIDSWNRDLTLTSLRDLLWRSLLERSLQEYCQETSYRDHHVQRSWQNPSFGDLAQRNCRDIC